ncbi:hypothetical protein OF83DRAFT_499105 [Amylostereum chailletii]|nr:hypothetical protein OF83DRAFT_499105 [Amylostereum chailletii]
MTGHPSHPQPTCALSPSPDTAFAPTLPPPPPFPFHGPINNVMPFLAILTVSSRACDSAPSPHERPFPHLPSQMLIPCLFACPTTETRPPVPPFAFHRPSSSLKLVPPAPILVAPISRSHLDRIQRGHPRLSESASAALGPSRLSTTLFLDDPGLASPDISSNSKATALPALDAYIRYVRTHAQRAPPSRLWLVLICPYPVDPDVPTECVSPREIDIASRARNLNHPVPLFLYWQINRAHASLPFPSFPSDAIHGLLSPIRFFSPLPPAESRQGTIPPTNRQYDRVQSGFPPLELDLRELVGLIPPSLSHRARSSDFPTHRRMQRIREFDVPLLSIPLAPPRTQ